MGPAAVSAVLLALTAAFKWRSAQSIDTRRQSGADIYRRANETARRGQLGSLNEAYARWSEADPATRGTVALKLSVEPSGKMLKSTK